MPVAVRSAAEVLRRLPFTVTVLVVMLAAGVVTGSLWADATEASWYPTVAYGLPSLEEGRWWTPLTGVFFAIVPATYVPMAGSFALFVGFAEWLRGTRFAVVAAVVAQVGAVLLSAALLLVLRGTGWPWAVETAGLVDVGFSAGALAVGALLSGSVPPPWQWRVRLGLSLYVVASFVFVGSFADVLHLVAGVAGLAVGTRPVRVPRREAVLLAAVSVPLVVVSGVALSLLLPSVSPLGDTTRPATVVLGVVVVLLVAPLLAFGVPRRAAR
ncbi:hypothetical protein [Saccharothrix obliqua]|uniref:hypothetical protein n=1 Tax=Saccharothrix obliqua TaxID=2861747 RepID=UPI001C5F0891|nr:hypothetical protein [Saccharothrix obliqua]MBW4717978.1 hypothetical protein [Saccharothrix obliqua]